MTSKSTIIRQMGLEMYMQACAHARKAAKSPNYGKEPNASPFDSNIAHQISDFVLESELSAPERVDLILQFYEEMPCYAYLMYIKILFSDLSKEEKTSFWQWVRIQIASEDNAIKAPLFYSLWCDFFEDTQTVQEAWKELITPLPSDKTLQMILGVSGPVPFDLKNQLFERLIDKSTWHPFIFQSLLYSQFDYYGKIDKQKALEILQRLKLPRNTKHLNKLAKELKS